MPNCLSAKKQLRQNKVRRDRNRSKKSVLRGSVRKIREAVAAGDIETAEASYQETAKGLDRAGSHRILHPKKVSRTKSRLQKIIKAAK